MPRVVRDGNFRKYKPMSHKPKTGKHKPPLKTVTVSVKITSNPESSIRVFSNGDQTGEVIVKCRKVGSASSSKYRIRANKYELLQRVKELQIGNTVTVSGTLHKYFVAGRSFSEIRVQSLEHISVDNVLPDENQKNYSDE